VAVLAVRGEHAVVSGEMGAGNAVEKLLEMTGRGGQLRVVTSVLPEQCLDLRRLEAP